MVNRNGSGTIVKYDNIKLMNLIILFPPMYKLNLYFIMKAYKSISFNKTMVVKYISFYIKHSNQTKLKKKEIHSLERFINTLGARVSGPPCFTSSFTLPCESVTSPGHITVFTAFLYAIFPIIPFMTFYKQQYSLR